MSTVNPCLERGELRRGYPKEVVNRDGSCAFGGHCCSASMAGEKMRSCPASLKEIRDTTKWLENHVEEQKFGYLEMALLVHLRLAHPRSCLRRGAIGKFRRSLHVACHFRNHPSGPTVPSFIHPFIHFFRRQ